MNVILYKQRDGFVERIYPTVEFLEFVTIDDMAKKNVPAPYTYEQDGVELTYNTPYWIVDNDTLPDDLLTRNAWEIDEAEAGDPHGYGTESSSYTDEQVSLLLEAGLI